MVISPRLTPEHRNNVLPFAPTSLFCLRAPQGDRDIIRRYHRPRIHSFHPANLACRTSSFHAGHPSLHSQYTPPATFSQSAIRMGPSPSGLSKMKTIPCISGRSTKRTTSSPSTCVPTSGVRAIRPQSRVVSVPACEVLGHPELVPYVVIVDIVSCIPRSSPSRPLPSVVFRARCRSADEVRVTHFDISDIGQPPPRLSPTMRGKIVLLPVSYFGQVSLLFPFTEAANGFRLRRIN